MRVETFHDPAAFLAVAEPWLREQPTENSLLWGIAATAAALPGAYGDTARFALVCHDGGPVLAALRTRPRAVVLSAGDPAAVPTLAESLRHLEPDSPGVTGPRALAEAFARAWAGAAWREQMAMRAYELREVSPDPRRPDGVLRPVSPEETGLLVRFVAGFDRDAHLGGKEPPERIAERMLRGGRAWLFEVDGDVVAATAGGVDIPAMGRIGMVYTPAELRGRGYGSAATAALSAKLLAEGAGRCVLFTDLANPTSNSIYQRIGYRPVCDYADLLFS
jgi:GNAT superfamily N-acetyltransferase